MTIVNYAQEPAAGHLVEVERREHVGDQRVGVGHGLAGDLRGLGDQGGGEEPRDQGEGNETHD